MAYVVGFFAADGYITVNKRGGQFWCIQITDRNLLFSIRKIIGSNHAISVRKRKNRTEKTQYRLQIGSIEMCNDLRAIGFSENKTKSLAVPYISKKYFPDFIRGYFDGDGNVWVGFLHKSRKIPLLGLQTMFTSCSYRFLHDIHERLRIHGVVGGSLYTAKGNFSRLQFSAKDSLKLYDFMYNGMVKDLPILYLKRKRVIFEKFKHLRP